MTAAGLYDLSCRAAAARLAGDGALAHECWLRIVEAVEASTCADWPHPGFESRGTSHTNRPGDVASVPGLDHEECTK